MSSSAGFCDRRVLERIQPDRAKRRVQGDDEIRARRGGCRRRRRTPRRSWTSACIPRRARPASPRRRRCDRAPSCDAPARSARFTALRTTTSFSLAARRSASCARGVLDAAERHRRAGAELGVLAAPEQRLPLSMPSSVATPPSPHSAPYASNTAIFSVRSASRSAFPFTIAFELRQRRSIRARRSARARRRRGRRARRRPVRARAPAARRASRSRRAPAPPRRAAAASPSGEHLASGATAAGVLSAPARRIASSATSRHGRSRSASRARPCSARRVVPRRPRAAGGASRFWMRPSHSNTVASAVRAAARTARQISPMRRQRRRLVERLQQLRRARSGALSRAGNLRELLALTPAADPRRTLRRDLRLAHQVGDVPELAGREHVQHQRVEQLGHLVAHLRGATAARRCRAASRRRSDAGRARTRVRTSVCRYSISRLVEEVERGVEVGHVDDARTRRRLVLRPSATRAVLVDVGDRSRLRRAIGAVASTERST